MHDGIEVMSLHPALYKYLTDMVISAVRSLGTPVDRIILPEHLYAKLGIEHARKMVGAEVVTWQEDIVKVSSGPDSINIPWTRDAPCVCTKCVGTGKSHRNGKNYDCRACLGQGIKNRVYLD